MLRQVSVVNCKSIQRSYSLFGSQKFILPSTAILLKQRPDYNNVNNLAQIKERKLLEMKQKYPHILEQTFNGKMVYTLQSRSPEELIRNGGFKNRNELWLSNTRSGNNKGCICFSLLPEVTTIFSKNYTNMPRNKLYLYAFPLFGNFLIPGGRWRQIISPGAFPLPSFWMCREFIGIDYQHKVMLGLLHVYNEKSKYIPGEKCNNYIENNLIAPIEKTLGGDSPSEFEINDTAYSAAFQAATKNYYSASRTHRIP